MALTNVQSYAISKHFMFKTIFKKFPGLHSEMLAESFSRYVKEFRRPCELKRKEAIQKYNKKHKYSGLNAKSGSSDIRKRLVAFRE